MSDDADTRAICPRCLRTEHSPSCLRRQAFEADKWQRRAESLASYVLGCDDSIAAGARDIVIGNFSAGYVWEPNGPRPDTVNPPPFDVRERLDAFADAQRDTPAPGTLDDADRIRAVLVEMVERTKGADGRIAILTDALRAVEGR